MPSDEQMQKRIQRILTNDPGYDRTQGMAPKKLLDKQIDTLNRFVRFLAKKPSPRGGAIKTATINTYLTRLRSYGLFLNKPFEEATQQDLIDYVGHIKDSKSKTKNISLVTLRSFYKWLNNMHKPHQIPEMLDHPLLKPPTSRVEKSPKELLTKDEIKKLLDVAGNNRNRCLIMLSIGEGGLRASEIVSANLSSVEFDSRGAKFYTEKSKSRERFVRLIDGEPYLRDYINREYELDKENKDNPLFYARHGFAHKRRIGPNAVSQLLRNLAKKAEIKKRVYCHLGRDINITKLNKLGMGSELIAKRHGITVKTMQNVYLRLDDKDADDAYTKIKDKLSEEEKKKLAEEEKKLSPKICHRCKERFPDKPELWKHPATALVCTCGMMLDGSNEQDLKTEFFSQMFDQYIKSLEKNPDLSLIEFMRMLKERL